VSPEIGVVLIEQDRIVGVLVEIPNTCHEQRVTRVILLQHFAESAALRSAVLRVCMIIVEAGPVAKDEIALDLTEGQSALGVLGKIVSLVAILKQFLDAKPARIAMRILAAVIPTHPHARSRGAAD
jgi:hypothetical protein